MHLKDMCGSSKFNSNFLSVMWLLYGHIFIQEEEHRRIVEEKEHRRIVEEKEAEVRRLAEAAELARLEVEKEAREHIDQTQDAYAVISDLDNALKAFQGALGLSDVSFIVSLVLYT